MDAEKITSELSRRYPGKKIVKNDEGNPTEIICELGPTNSGGSMAVAVIDRSKLHFHHRTTETYKVMRGELIVSVDGQDHKLKEGESMVIEPGSKHSAVGNETWVEVYSHPGWTAEDHILAE